VFTGANCEIPQQVLGSGESLPRDFQQQLLTLETFEDRQRVADHIAAALSPENLTCDGELSRSEVQRRYTLLKGAEGELFKLDPKVELYATF